MKKFLSIFLVSIFVTIAGNGFAQDNIEINYKSMTNVLNTMERNIKKGNLNGEEINSKAALLNDIKFNLNSAKKEYEKEQKYIQKKIEALGEAPKEGETEVALIAQKRKEFNKELDNQKAKIAEVVLLNTRIDELETTLFNLRNKVILGNVLDRQPPLIYPKNFFAATGLFISYTFDIVHSPIDWYAKLKPIEVGYVDSNWLTVLLIAFVSLWVGVYLRLFIMRKFGYSKENDHPRYSKKVSAAIFVAIAYGVIPASIIAGFLLWTLSANAFDTGFFSLLIKSGLYYLLYIVLANAVARVIFAPYNEKWRLININNEKAKRVTNALYFSIWTIGVTSWLEHVANKSGYPIQLSALLSTMSDASKALAIILVVKRFLWDGIDTKEDDDLSEAEDEAEDAEEQNAFKVTLFFTIFALGTFSLSLLGYPFLSTFILNKFLLSFLIVGLLFILNKAFRELLHRILLLRFWVKTFKLRRRIISKLNFWLSLVVDPLFIVFGIFLILALWGVSTEFLKQALVNIFVGFTIGGVKISLIAIVLGILVFFVGISLIRALKRRLMNNILAKMDIDEGIKHSLASGFGFFGFVVSALLAIAVMGGDLTNFALIAGALSFGIGLGLQNIVNNFVSGIILLFERPIKVGDWVVVNGQEGIVKQINIRATELQTWKKASIIIPNADLLSNTVTNLTHGDTWGRLDIPVGVAYGSDTRKVAEILLECAEAQKRVLKKPNPYVLFTNFGDSSLDFELRCYTADVMNGISISSEIRFDIDRRFREENIEIPFPQRTLHIGDQITRDSLNAKLQESIKPTMPKKATKAAKTSK